jgi:hypothetical protein
MASIPLYRCVRTCVFDLTQSTDSLLCSAFHQVAKGLEEVAHISCLFFFCELSHVLYPAGPQGSSQSSQHQNGDANICEQFLKHRTTGYLRCWLCAIFFFTLFLIRSKDAHEFLMYVSDIVDQEFAGLASSASLETQSPFSIDFDCDVTLIRTCVMCKVCCLF